VEDQLANPITSLTDSDTRFTVVQLVDGTGSEKNWQAYFISGSAATYQRTNDAGGGWTNDGGGNYTYTFGDGVSAAMVFTGIAANANLHRISMQTTNSVSNGWFDFKPDTATLDTAITSSLATSREIVTTATCNGCHDADGNGDGLALHGGTRRDVEYCVTCHNPDSTDSDTGNTVDFKVMIHKIHRGKNLPSVQAGTPYQIIGYGGSVHDYSLGAFPQEVNDCTSCHTGGTESTNWSANISMEACTSCHDNVTFNGTVPTGNVDHETLATGPQYDNSGCNGCHAAGQVQDVTKKHRWDQIKTRALDIVYTINSATYDAGTGAVTVNYNITDGGVDYDVTTDPGLFTSSGGSLSMKFGWKNVGEADYTNPGAGESAPGSAISVNLLTATGVTAELDGSYTAVVTLPAGAQAAGTGIVFMDGHPVDDMVITNTFDRLPVKNPTMEFAINDSSVQARRVVVDDAKCVACHDVLSLHGSNRNGVIQVCTTCHNSANSDVGRRPADPTTTADLQSEQSIDFKVMIHRIHAGRDTTAGKIVVYGYGNSEHVFAGEYPPGTPLNNCEVCHNPGTYQTDLVAGILGTTVDSGVAADHTDDINISPATAVCSTCHDSPVPIQHMKSMGGSFNAFQDEIVY
jgi:OmcA/MtrC family decaheme c-type cytochrome